MSFTVPKEDSAGTALEMGLDISIFIIYKEINLK